MANLNAQQKLEKLLGKHTGYRADFARKLESWEEQLKNAITTQKFGEHEIIKKVRKGYATEIKEINDVLLFKDELTEADRVRLLDKRALCLRFLNLFREADATIETLEQAITYELGDN